jgi:hypothetical protein
MMAKININYIEQKGDFDFDAFYEYWSDRTQDGLHIWTSEFMDYQRLPGNINIFQFLMYVGQRLESYLGENRYSGEKIVYSPAFPDIIYSLESDRQGGVSSPEAKIPPSISYLVRKRSPKSMDGVPFGVKKDYKWNFCGDFKGEDDKIYQVRFRRWESLVEFTAIWRSGAQADALCMVFEQFMDLNEGKFLEAGIARMLPFGRISEPEPRLSNAGVSYRKTLFYFETQEFQVAGPTVPISEVDLDIVPSSGLEQHVD